MKYFKFFTLILLTIAVISCSKEAVNDVNKNNTTTSTTGDNNSGNGGGGSNTGGGDTNALTTLLLTGDITNEEAEKEIAKVSDKTKAIEIKNTTQLTKVDISKITNVSSLVILENEQLTTVSLPNLVEVNSSLDISDNLVLKEINLSALKKIGTFLFVNNDKVTGVDFNIETLTSGNFSLKNNASLKFARFPKMISKTISDNHNLSIAENDALEEVSLPLVEEVSNIWVSDNPKLTNLNMQGLKRIVNIYYMRYNSSLSTLSFPSLEEVGSDIFMTSGLTNYSVIDFPKLKIIKGDLDILDQGNLKTINFPELTTIEEHLSINKCSVIKEVVFPSLLSLNHSLDIEDNTSLEKVNFPQLTTINKHSSGRHIWVRDNIALALVSFENLKEFDEGDIKIDISHNTVFNSLPLLDIKFPNIESIRDLWVDRVNLKEMNFSKLNKVEDIVLYNTKGIEVFNFPQLELAADILIKSNENLKGLLFPLMPKMNHLSIRYNKALTRLNLEFLKSVEGGINIGYNSLLNEINLPILSKALSINIEYNENLNTVNLASLTDVEKISASDSNYNNSFDLSSITNFNKILIHSAISLNQSSIDAILARLVAISPPITGKEILLEGNPSSVGLQNEQTLKNQGNNIIVYD